MPPLLLSQLNALDEATFTAALSGIFEHSPWVARRVRLHRPFDSVDLLHSAMCTMMQKASQEEQLALIQAHPDLGDRLTPLTPESTTEQAAAGLDQMTEDELQQFHNANEAYKKKFGFPFILCARLNDRHTMLAAFEQRLMQDRAREFQTALAEIEKIARLRLNSVVSDG